MFFMMTAVTLRSDYECNFDGSVGRTVLSKAPVTDTFGKFDNSCWCRASMRKCLIKIRVRQRKELSLSNEFLRNKGSGDCDSLIMPLSYVWGILLLYTRLVYFCQVSQVAFHHSDESLKMECGETYILSNLIWTM